MSATIGGLRRLLGAPLLWFGMFLGLAATAYAIGLQVQTVVAASVGPFDTLDLDRVVFATVDILRDHPAIGAAIETALLGGMVMSALVWTLLSPLCIARLAAQPGERGASRLGAIALASLGPVIAQSLWHLVLRGLFVAAVILAAQPLPTLGLWIATGLVWLVCGVALDAARVAVVHRGADPWHVRTTLHGFRDTLRRPSVLIPGLVLGLLQWTITATVLWLSLRSYGDVSSVWPARVGALAGVGLGLWRIGIVIEGLGPRPDASSTDAETA